MNNHPASKHPILILTLVLIIIPIIGSSVDIFVPSLPFIASHFHTTPETTRLAVTYYLISYGVFQLAFGGISDSFGRRSVLIVSMLGYLVCVLMIPISSSIQQLLLWRTLQGLFAAGIGVIGRAIIPDSFKGIVLAKYASYVTIAWAIGPTLSPYLGGYLQEYLNWQAPFYFLAGYSFIATLLIIFMLPETSQHRHKFNIKTISHNYKLILHHRGFLGGAIICGLSYGVITLFNTVGPFLIEATLKYGPVTYGYVALFLGLGWFTGNLATRALITRPNMKNIVKMSIIAFLIIAITMSLFALFNVFNLWTTTIPTICIFVFCGVLFTYFFGKCLSLFPEMSGSASAMLGSIFSIIAGCMAGVGSILHDETLLPIAIAYVSLAIIVYIVYYFLTRSMLNAC